MTLTLKPAKKIFGGIKSYLKRVFKRNPKNGKATITACYMYESGFDYFKIGKDSVERVLNCNVSFINRIFGKNVLVIGKDVSFYLRSKYPPTNDKNLMGMISNELDELFPMITSPAFYFHVFEKHENYVLVDIWAWESKAAGCLADAFPYNYTVPEDVLFKSPEYEVSVFFGSGKTFMIAHGPKGFIGTRVYIRAVTAKDVETFIRGLGGAREKIRVVNFFVSENTVGTSSGFALSLPIVETTQRDYPAALQHIAAFNLSPFLSKPWYTGLDFDFFLRVSAYSMACYMISTYISLNRLDGVATELQSKISETNKKVMLLAEIQAKDVTSKVLTTLAGKITETMPPLEVLDALAVATPEEARFQQIQITNRNVNATVLTADPASAIKSLSTSPAVEFVALVGEPQKDSQDKYRINLSITVAESAKLSQALQSQKAIVEAPLPTIASGGKSDNTLKAPSSPQAIFKSDKANTLQTPSSPAAMFKSDKVF